MLSMDEMIHDDEEFEVDACGIDDREWGEAPFEYLASERFDPREIVDLTSPDAKNSSTKANCDNIRHVQIDDSPQAGAQSEVVEGTRNDEGMVEYDNLQRRRGTKRRVHTVCEWSSSSREKMIKHLHIDLT